VFLDYANVPPADSMFGIHPHSGIATLTVVISGALVYEDTTGKSGTVGAGPPSCQVEGRPALALCTTGRSHGLLGVGL
jgi:hypothetical protein